MKALLVHLSDIHVRSDHDQILSRAEAIAAAVQNLDPRIEAAVIAVSGDLAYSGGELQYLAVWAFLDQLRTRLATQLAQGDGRAPAPVAILAIPGNHDCDFTERKVSRELIVQGVLESPERAGDQSVVDICLEVQAPFFAALEEYSEEGLGEAMSAYDRRLAYEYRIPVGDKTLRFLCFNTAWLSQRREEQGKLYLPADVVPANREGDDVVVAMFHHPYNWLDADTYRAFRARIEGVADLVLTGHEHDAAVRTQQTTTGERNLYIEGGALQDSVSPDESAFNAFVLDLAARKQKTARLAWDGARYIPLGASSDTGDMFGLTWEELQITRLRESGRFELTDLMRQYLEDLGIGLAHRSGNTLQLSDIFIFPDVQEVTYPPNGGTRTIRSSRVEDLITDSPRLLITGDYQAGKTSFAKMAFGHLHAAGYVPVLLDAASKPPTDERLPRRLVDLYGEQYSTPGKDAYRQLDRSRRAIIVDNYHRLPSSPRARNSFIRTLAEFADRIILVAHDLAAETAALLQPRGRVENTAPFAAYRIMPFGPARRAELVDRWLLLDEDANANTVEFAHQRERIIAVFNGLIGRRWLPAYPVYMLSVLQSHEAVNPMDSQISTYGAYYEILIRAALARGQAPIQAEVIRSYLAHFAHQLFRNRLTEVDDSTFTRIHGEYERRYEITRSADALRSYLTTCQVFAVSGDTLQFRYKYIYYYFVASWLRDHIGEPATQETIATLSRSVHIEEHANILLFLAHLSKDPLIVRELIAAAQSFYPDAEPAKLADDVEFFSNLKPGGGEVVYDERDINEARRRRLEALDEEEALQDEDSPDDPDDELTADLLDPVVRFTAAAKTLEILEQILKNFPGSLEGPIKLDIAQECYSLGLRALASLYGEIQANQAVILDGMIAAIKAEAPRLQDKRLEARAQETIAGLAELLGFSIVKMVTTAVGSRELDQTYKRVIEQGATPAMRLIDTSIKLDHSVPFPTKAVRDLAGELRSHYFARQILKYLIVNHFHIFPEEMQVKQRVCAAVGIQYNSLLGANPARKLLTDGTQRT